MIGRLNHTLSQILKATIITPFPNKNNGDHSILFEVGPHTYTQPTHTHNTHIYSQTQTRHGLRSFPALLFQPLFRHAESPTVPPFPYTA